MPDPQSLRFKVLRLYCKASAIGCVGLGFAVLYGWALHIPLLMSVLPGLVTMKVNTALCIVFSGASLWLLLPHKVAAARSRSARFLALLVVLIGGATLTEYSFGIDLRIDQLILNDPVGSLGTSSPGRPAPTTATALIAIGLALLMLHVKTRQCRRPSQLLSLWAGLIAMMAINGYIYHASAVSRIFLYTQVAVHTAVALLLLSSAIFFARPRTGIAGDLTSRASGSIMARRLLPAVFLIPVFLGWICLQGQLMGVVGARLGLALYATINIIVFAVLVWLSARQVNKEYDHRNIAEAGIRELNAVLEERVAARTQALEEQAAVLKEQTALLDLAQDAVVVRDMQQQILFWNRGAEAMYGWLRHETVGKNVRELLGTVFPENNLEEIEAELLRLDHWEGEVIHHKRDGTPVTVAIRVALQRDAEGVPVRVLTINNDITERKGAESRLQLLTERLSLAAAVAKVGVWEWDLASNTVTWDATMCEIYGFAPVVTIPYERWSAAVHPEDLAATEAMLRKVVAEKSEGSAEFRIFRADNSLRNISAAERVVLDAHRDVVRVIGVNMDITERQQADVALRESEARMTHSAEHDFLTGLPNRMLLNDRVNQAIIQAPRRSKRVAVLFLDLDGFKHINDSLGHPTGDKLLQSIATRLQQCVRGSDTVSRQGGDEFVVLLSEIEHPEDAAITARRMLQAVAEAHSIDQHDLHVTTSIGVSVSPDDGLDAETLIKNADTAMYQAKESGRHGYQFFKPAMNVRAVERQSIEEGLRRALERQEFSLHYQPKVNLQTGQVTGAEALLRWTHPTRGAVSPVQFIPVAEDCGLILPIGKWVLREACLQAKLWADEGLLIGTMAVNISAVQFRGDGFLEGIFATLADTGLNPNFLELELTESVLMKHADSTVAILEALRARGIHLAIDDFGTGYSSLSYLRKFPIDALKIDQSFVRQITTSPQETTIVTAVISMARSLKLCVIAEGVETEAELAFLLAHKCDEAQGYYFSRPLPAEQFTQLLKTGTRKTGPRQMAMSIG
jgi:diguanylate cyclase (GGDEF)-like protein/PAS domain S-box-containing protein